MRRIEWGTIAFIILWILISLWMLIYNKKVGAQDISITVCRDPYLESPRFEFHNMPLSWQDGSEAFWYLADGATFVDGVFVADAYPLDSDSELAGQVIVGSTDYSVEVRGDAQTPLCSVPTPEPTETPQTTYSASTIAQPIASSGRTCTIKYPEIILVCNG
jgi:hypothetical protein